MKKLAELRARLRALKAQGLAIYTGAETDDGRDLTEDELTNVEKIQIEADEVAAEISTLERQADARRAMEAIEPGDAAAALPYALQNQVGDLNPATTHGFKDLMEFAVSVRAGCAQGAVADQRLHAMQPPRRADAPTNFHQGGGDAGEGFTVPPQFRDEMFTVMEGADEFGPLVDEEATVARRVEMLADESTPWGASGVQAVWRTEGSAMVATKLDTDPRSVPLHEIYAFVLATGELLDDSPRMAGRLTDRAGRALAWKKNDAMMRGTGAGQPEGWLNSGAVISIAKEGSQVADTVVAENVLKMFARLMVVPGDTPLWLANRNTVPSLAVMVIGDQPVWTPPGMLLNAPQGALLGIPLMLTEHANTVGDVGDIQLISPKGYYSLKRQTAPDFASSIHLFFDYNVEAFRWMTRFGGQTHLEAAVDAPTVGGGSGNSKSHFVTLDERT